MSKPAAKSKSPAKKSSIVEVVAETGHHVEPPPPEILEADPDLSPEAALRLRQVANAYWHQAEVTVALTNVRFPRNAHREMSQMRRQQAMKPQPAKPKHISAAAVPGS